MNATNEGNFNETSTVKRVPTAREKKRLERDAIIKEMIRLEKIETPERELIISELKNKRIDAKVFRLDLWKNTEFDLMLDFTGHIESSYLETLKSLGYTLDKIYTFHAKKHRYYNEFTGSYNYALTAIFKKPYVSAIVPAQETS